MFLALCFSCIEKSWLLNGYDYIDCGHYSLVLNLSHNIWFKVISVSFIENYGTHIVTSATIGGRDIVYIRQHQASPLSVTDIENYLNDIGEQRFSDSRGNSSAGSLKYKDKVSATVILMDDLFS